MIRMHIIVSYRTKEQILNDVTTSTPEGFDKMYQNPEGHGTANHYIELRYIVAGIKIVIESQCYKETTINKLIQDIHNILLNKVK